MASQPELTVHEIYHSIQGESTWAGLPFIIVRLTGCPLRCTYCDTTYAYEGGHKAAVESIVKRVRTFDCPHVLVTGGEPLAQADCPDLLAACCDAGWTTLLETAGSHDVSTIDERVHLIMDLKTPGSGESDRNRWSNVEHLQAVRDEVKFVLTNREDYDWAKQQILEHALADRVRAILLSPAHDCVSYAELAQWILDDGLPPPIRLHLQLHKHIWGPDTQGV